MQGRIQEIFERSILILHPTGGLQQNLISILPYQPLEGRFSTLAFDSGVCRRAKKALTVGRCKTIGVSGERRTPRPGLSSGTTALSEDALEYKGLTGTSAQR